MNLEDFKEIEDIVENKNYKERNEIKFKSVKVAGITANLINIGLMFNIVLFLAEQWTKDFSFFGKSFMVMSVVLLLLSIAEYLKRFLIYEAFLNSYINNWKNGTVNLKSKIQLFVAGLIIILSGFTAINGTKQLADKSETVETVTDNNYDIELKKLQETKQESDTETNSTYNPKIKRHPVHDTEGLKELTSTKSKELENHKLTFDNAKVELDKKYSKVTNRSQSSNSYIVFGSYLFTFLIEIGIVFALLFESKYKWESYLEEKEKIKQQKQMEVDKKIKTSESWKNYLQQKKLLKEIYNNYKSGETLPPSKLSGIVKIKGLNFTSTYIKNFYEILASKGIVGEEKYKKRPFLMIEEEAFDLLKEYYGFKNITEES